MPSWPRGRSDEAFSGLNQTTQTVSVFAMPRIIRRWNRDMPACKGKVKAAVEVSSHRPMSASSRQRRHIEVVGFRRGMVWAVGQTVLTATVVIMATALIAAQIIVFETAAGLRSRRLVWLSGGSR